MKLHGNNFILQKMVCFLFTELNSQLLACKSFALYCTIKNNSVIYRFGCLEIYLPSLSQTTQSDCGLPQCAMSEFSSKHFAIDVFCKWRLWHGKEARMLFSRPILVSNYQTGSWKQILFGSWKQVLTD